MPQLLLATILCFLATGPVSPALGEQPKQAAPGEFRSFKLSEDGVVYCIGFSPDGKTVAAGTAGGSLLIWDTEKPEAVRNLHGTSNDILTGGILSLAFSSDGKRILLGCADRTVQVWDLATSKKLHTLRGHRGPVWSVAFFKDGKRALSGSTSDYTIREWDLDQGKETRKFQAQERPSCLSLSSDEASFVTTEFKTVQLWDLKTGKVKHSFAGHGLRVESVFFAPDRVHIVSASADGIVKVWDLQTGKCVKEFGDKGILVEKMALAPDGRRVLVGKTNEMQLWDVETGQKLKQFDNLSGGVRVAFSPDGRYALSGEMWGRVRMWELPKAAEKKRD